MFLYQYIEFMDWDIDVHNEIVRLKKLKDLQISSSHSLDVVYRDFDPQEVTLVSYRTITTLFIPPLDRWRYFRFVLLR